MEKIQIKSMIVLCHIIHDYESFMSQIKLYMKENNNGWDFLYELGECAYKRRVKDEIKKFYQENKSIIDTIKKHMEVGLFLIDTIWVTSEKTMNYLYNYIIKHENEIDKILTLLKYIESLGFVFVNLDENYDFSKEKYEVLGPWENFTYLENMVRLPIYGNSIRYKSTGSHYQIKINCQCFDGKAHHKMDEIYLNSLLFDPSLLPQICEPLKLYDEIVSLKDELRAAIELELKLNSLKEELYSIGREIENFSVSSAKESLEDSLHYMKLELVRMEQISNEYNNSLEEYVSIKGKYLKEKENVRVKLRRKGDSI